MNAATDQKAITETPIGKFRAQLEQRLETFAEALPPQITPQRFKSIIMWAVTADPGLLAADRVSLFESCLSAANDGLLPDKKEGALVIYNTKIKEDGKEFWIKKVQWMPMIRGIFTKVYNTGKVKTTKVEIVYGGDRFRAWTDDAGDHIEYEEAEDQDRDIIRNAFALVVMKDSEGGGVFVQTLKPADIEKIRSKSKKSESGPWADWWEEMAKKSVFRRLAKRLPMARELDQVISRDDYMYDAVEGRDYQGIERTRAPIPPRPPTAMLGAPVARPMPMATPTTRDVVTVDAELGEVGTNQPPAAGEQPAEQQIQESEAGSPPTGSDALDKQASPPKATATEQKPSSATVPQADDGNPIEVATRKGRAAYRNDLSERAVPAEYRAKGREAEKEAWIAGFRDEADKDAPEPGSVEAE